MNKRGQTQLLKGKGKRQLGRHTGSTCRNEYIETDGE